MPTPPRPFDITLYAYITVPPQRTMMRSAAPNIRLMPGADIIRVLFHAFKSNGHRVISLSEAKIFDDYI